FEALDRARERRAVLIGDGASCESLTGERASAEGARAASEMKLALTERGSGRLEVALVDRGASEHVEAHRAECVAVHVIRALDGFDPRQAQTPRLVELSLSPHALAEIAGRSRGGVEAALLQLDRLRECPHRFIEVIQLHVGVTEPDPREAETGSQL